MIVLIIQNGGWEGNSNDLTASSMPNAVINLSGALIDADYISEGEPPLFSIHGQLDEVIPACLGQTTVGELIEPFYLEGSCLVHERAVSQGITSFFRFPENGRHDAPFNDQVCQDCISRLPILFYLNFSKTVPWNAILQYRYWYADINQRLG